MDRSSRLGFIGGGLFARSADSEAEASPSLDSARGGQGIQAAFWRATWKWPLPLFEAISCSAPCQNALAKGDHRIPERNADIRIGEDDVSGVGAPLRYEELTPDSTGT